MGTTVLDSLQPSPIVVYTTPRAKSQIFLYLPRNWYQGRSEPLSKTMICLSPPRGISVSAIEDVKKVVCVLSGGEIPFVIRRLDKAEDEGKDAFLFLCEYCFHVIMDGEGVEDSESWPSEALVIN